MNKENRHRTDVVGILPNRAATRRPVGAALAGKHDEWAKVRRYLTLANDIDTGALPAVNTLEAAPWTTSTRMTPITPNCRSATQGGYGH